MAAHAPPFQKQAATDRRLSGEGPGGLPLGARGSLQHQPSQDGPTDQPPRPRVHQSPAAAGVARSGRYPATRSATSRTDCSRPSFISQIEMMGKNLVATMYRRMNPAKDRKST